MSNSSVEKWFQGIPNEQSNLLTELRNLVLSTDAAISEELKWQRPCYSVNRKLFCYLDSTKNHATIGFQKGASLKDPELLLEGTGKDMRHIKLNPSLVPSWAAIQDLVSNAYQAAT